MGIISPPVRIKQVICRDCHPQEIAVALRLCIAQYDTTAKSFQNSEYEWAARPKSFETIVAEQSARAKRNENTEFEQSATHFGKLFTEFERSAMHF